MDILQMDYIRLKPVQQAGEPAPGFGGIDAARHNLKPGNGILALVKIAKINMADEQVAIGIGQVAIILHTKKGYIMAVAP